MLKNLFENAELQLPTLIYEYYFFFFTLKYV